MIRLSSITVHFPNNEYQDMLVTPMPNMNILDIKTNISKFVNLPTNSIEIQNNGQIMKNEAYIESKDGETKLDCIFKNTENKNSNSKVSTMHKDFEDSITYLENLNFPREMARNALISSNGDLESALALLRTKSIHVESNNDDSDDVAEPILLGPIYSTNSEIPAQISGSTNPLSLPNIEPPYTGYLQEISSKSKRKTFDYNYYYIVGTTKDTFTELVSSIRQNVPPTQDLNHYFSKCLRISPLEYDRIISIRRNPLSLSENDSFFYNNLPKDNTTLILYRYNIIKFKELINRLHSTDLPLETAFQTITENWPKIFLHEYKLTVFLRQEMDSSDSSQEPSDSEEKFKPRHINYSKTMDIDFHALLKFVMKEMKYLKITTSDLPENKRKFAVFTEAALNRVYNGLKAKNDITITQRYINMCYKCVPLVSEDSLKKFASRHDIKGTFIVIDREKYSFKDIAEFIIKGSNDFDAFKSKFEIINFDKVDAKNPKVEEHLFDLDIHDFDKHDVTTINRLPVDMRGYVYKMIEKLNQLHLSPDELSAKKRSLSNEIYIIIPRSSFRKIANSLVSKRAIVKNQTLTLYLNICFSHAPKITEKAMQRIVSDPTIKTAFLLFTRKDFSTPKLIAVLNQDSVESFITRVQTINGDSIDSEDEFPEPPPPPQIPPVVEEEVQEMPKKRGRKPRKKPEESLKPIETQKTEIKHEIKHASPKKKIEEKAEPKTESADQTASKRRGRPKKGKTENSYPIHQFNEFPLEPPVFVHRINDTPMEPVQAHYATIDPIPSQHAPIDPVNIINIAPPVSEQFHEQVKVHVEEPIHSEVQQLITIPIADPTMSDAGEIGQVQNDYPQHDMLLMQEQPQQENNEAQQKATPQESHEQNVDLEDLIDRLRKQIVTNEIAVELLKKTNNNVSWASIEFFRRLWDK